MVTFLANWISKGTSQVPTGVNTSVSNIPLGFSFYYFGVAYTTVTVYTNGMVALGGSSANQLAVAYNQQLSTASTGAVYYKQVTNSSELTFLSSQLVDYSLYSGFVYNATAAFTITWAKVQNMINIQMTLVTDFWLNTFAIVNYDYFTISGMLTVTTSSGGLGYDLPPGQNETILYQFNEYSGDS
jgi:hypothetical protein